MRLLRTLLRERSVVPVALLALTGLLAAACGAGGGEAGEEPGAATPAPGQEEEAGVELGERVGGELRLPGPDPLTLDPALTSDAGSATYVVEIFGGLVTFDRDLNLIPDLAESIPEPETNPDGTVSYTFTIREDAKFHNGRPVTAEDFKYSIERAAAPETLSPTASLYLDDIVGFRDFARGRAEELTGVEVLDDRTLRITIDGPKEYFLQKLTYPTAFVVDQREVEPNPQTWFRKPNGTGPFKLVEWTLNEKVVLEANERYHLGAPGVDRVTFLLAGNFLTLYENGELDISGVPLTDIERARDPAEALNAELIENPSLDIFYIGFNLKEPPFDDPLVRQAFAIAIDKGAIARVALRDAAVVAQGILPPGMPGYDPNFQGLPYDPERARQLLEESSYGGPEGLPRIVWTTSGQGASPGDVVEAIQAMWRQNLGVEVEVEQVEFGTFLLDVERGRFQMWDLGWIADYVDPQDFVDILFFSESRQNDFEYANPEVDALLEEARTEPDAARRLDLYRQAERLIINDAPFIPLFHSKNVAVVKPYVQNYEPPPFVIPILRYISLSQ